MVEAGAVVGEDGNVVFWHIPDGRHGGAIPDSRTLWDVLWEGRKSIQGFAHSHPGNGVPGPSHTDVTTFAAVEAALGRRLTWWIVSADKVAEVRWTGPDKLSYRGYSVRSPAWTAKLRELSGYAETRCQPE